MHKKISPIIKGCMNTQVSPPPCRIPPLGNYPLHYPLKSREPRIINIPFPLSPPNENIQGQKRALTNTRKPTNDPILPSNYRMGSLTDIYMAHFFHMSIFLICFSNNPIFMVLDWYQEYQNLMNKYQGIFDQQLRSKPAINKIRNICQYLH